MYIYNNFDVIVIIYNHYAAMQLFEILPITVHV